MHAKAIQVNQLRRVYATAQADVVALDSVNLDIGVGRFIAVKGKSGSGKTTLLNCLGGLDQPSEGTILIHDRQIHELSEQELTDWRQKEVGFIFQAFGLLPTLSAYENVELMLRIAGVPRAERRERALYYLELVGLGQWTTHRPLEMSGGQQQRLAIARALANKPKLILADEATGELDTETTQTILTLLQTIVREENVTILLATHDNLVDDYVDEVLQLSDGQIVKRDIFVPEATSEAQLDTSAAVATPRVSSKRKKAKASAWPLPIDDSLWAVLLGLAALIIFGRTLATDVLYSDSAEFQLLAHTLGLAHTSGYPVYILLTKLLSFLPIGTLAFRVNLLSTLAATGTLVGVFFLIRFTIENRIAAVLATFALLLSGAFWSQAIIAEVYTMGTLWWVMIALCLWIWLRNPAANRWYLFAGALICATGLGIHLFVLLAAPAAIIMVLWTLRNKRELLRSQLLIAISGTVAGLAIYLLAFYVIDVINSPTSYNNVMLFPSRSLWGLSPADYDTYWERLYLSLSAPQWQEAMFSSNLGAELLEWLYGFLAAEFSLLFVIGAIVGSVHLFRQNKPQFIFLIGTILVVLQFVLNYNPGDQYLFFLPLNVAAAVLAGIGFAWILERVQQFSPKIVTPVIVVMVLLIGQHLWPSRLESIVAGEAVFARQTYSYPVGELEQPREIAMKRIEQLPRNPVLIVDWRALYSTYYVAIIEENRDDLIMLESTPFGSDGTINQTLLQEIDRYVQENRPVFTDQSYFPLDTIYNVEWDESVELFRVRQR